MGRERKFAGRFAGLNDSEAQAKKELTTEQSLAETALDIMLATTKDVDREGFERDMPLYWPLILNIKGSHPGEGFSDVEQSIEINIQDKKITIDLCDAIQRLNGEARGSFITNFKNILVQEADEGTRLEEAEARLKKDIRAFIAEKFKSEGLENFEEIEIITRDEGRP